MGLRQNPSRRAAFGRGSGVAALALLTLVTLAQPPFETHRPAAAQPSAAGPTPGGDVKFSDCGTDCDLGGRVYLDVPRMVIKTASPKSVVEPGGNVTFSVLVHNRSTTDSATVVFLDDDVYGDITVPSPFVLATDCATGASLSPDDFAPGGPDEYACSFLAPVAGVGGFVATDTVTAGLDYGLAGFNDPEGSVDVPVLGATLTKTPVPSSLPAPGGTVKFLVQIRNQLSVPLTLTSLVDDVYGDVPSLPQSNCAAATVVAPGGLYNCKFKAQVTGVPFDVHKNTLTASLTDGTATFNPSDTAKVTISGTLDARSEPRHLGPPATGAHGATPTATPGAPAERLDLVDVDGSGIGATIVGGADLRIYDLNAYAGNPDATGQALIDFSWPDGVPDNRAGTIFELSQPVRAFCLRAGDYGSDDDGMLRIDTFLGASPGPFVETAWPETAFPPFTVLKAEAPGGIDRVEFTSGGPFPNSVFVDDFSFVPLGVSGPPGVPDGTMGDPMTVAKLAPDGSDLLISWDTMACCEEADGHHLLFGAKTGWPASPGGLYTLQGALCQVASGSSFSWIGAPDPDSLDPVNRLLWWVVVASRDFNEGSWGRDGASAERNGTGPGCEPKVLTNACGHAP